MTINRKNLCANLDIAADFLLVFFITTFPVPVRLYNQIALDREFIFSKPFNHYSIFQKDIFLSALNPLVIFYIRMLYDF